MNGIINVNKDVDMTSHDVVAILRKSFNIKKVGHTGTLDPMVGGVLPICLGKATRVSEYIQNQGKEYIGELEFGIKTDSLDFTGNILAKGEIPKIDEYMFRLIQDEFTGDIEQIPPMYSALKVNGQKLVDLARQGKVIERKSRKVTIYSFDVLKKTDKGFIFKVACSKGTYIRSLIDDIGKRFGTYAYMKKLKRIRVGAFRIEDSIDIKDLRKLSLGEATEYIMPIDRCLYDLKSLKLDSSYFKPLIHGQKLRLSLEALEEYTQQDFKVYAGSTFIGLGEIVEDEGLKLKMKKVLIWR